MQRKEKQELEKVLKEMERLGEKIGYECAGPFASALNSGSDKHTYYASLFNRNESRCNEYREETGRILGDLQKKKGAEIGSAAEGLYVKSASVGSCRFWKDDKVRKVDMPVECQRAPDEQAKARKRFQSLISKEEEVTSARYRKA